MPITPDLTKQMLEALRGSGMASDTYKIRLRIGGYARIRTNVLDAEVGLFNAHVDGNVQSMGDITTEPALYHRAEYVHEEGYEIVLNVEEATQIIDAWFLALDGELVAYENLERRQDITNATEITFESPMLEIS